MIQKVQISAFLSIFLVATLDSRPVYYRTRPQLMPEWFHDMDPLRDMGFSLRMVVGGKIYNVLVDTGSKVTWFICREGVNQFARGCRNALCQGFNGAHCEHGTCHLAVGYKSAYVEGEAVMGKVGILVPVYECVEQVYMSFACATYLRNVPDGIQGVLGLGPAWYSYVSQLKVRRFTYCISLGDERGDELAIGVIAFGGNASFITGFPPPQVVPFAAEEDKYYVLKVWAIKFGRFYMYVDDLEVVLDTGSSKTWLPREHFSTFMAITNGFALSNSSEGSLCYRVGNTKDFPNISIYFSNGAEMAIPASSYMKMVGRGNACIDVHQASTTRAVLGARFQQNFQVLYDLAMGTVAFKRVDCSDFIPYIL